MYCICNLYNDMKWFYMISDIWSPFNQWVFLCFQFLQCSAWKALLRIEREHVQQLQQQLIEAEATARLPEAGFDDGSLRWHGWFFGRILLNPWENREKRDISLLRILFFLEGVFFFFLNDSKNMDSTTESIGQQQWLWENGRPMRMGYLFGR